MTDLKKNEEFEQRNKVDYEEWVKARLSEAQALHLVYLICKEEGDIMGITWEFFHSWPYDSQLIFALALVEIGYFSEEGE